MLGRLAARELVDGYRCTVIVCGDLGMLIAEVRASRAERVEKTTFTLACLANMGIDVKCGGCMMRAFTGQACACDPGCQSAASAHLEAAVARAKHEVVKEMRVAANRNNWTSQHLCDVMLAKYSEPTAVAATEKEG